MTQKQSFVTHCEDPHHHIVCSFCFSFCLCACDHVCVHGTAVRKYPNDDFGPMKLN